MMSNASAIRCNMLTIRATVPGGEIDETPKSVLMVETFIAPEAEVGRRGGDPSSLISKESISDMRNSMMRTPPLSNTMNPRVLQIQIACELKPRNPQRETPPPMEQGQDVPMGGSWNCYGPLCSQ